MANDENLIPAKPGEIRNPKGRPKGVKNWSTIVKRLLADETLADKLLAKKPGWWDDLPNKNLANAIVAAMITQALNGSHKAAEWLRKTGYGDKLDLTTKNKAIKAVSIFDLSDPYADSGNERGDQPETGDGPGSDQES